eukprot:7295486-Karenia_brevis.AAC.1
MQSAGITGGQVADVVLALRLIIHNFHVWPFDGQLYVVKIDIKKAFDSVFVSAIIRMLQFLMDPLWLQLAYVKSVVACIMIPFVNGERASPVECKRGMRQGRADSMKCFCCLLCFLLQPLISRWQQQQMGILIGLTRFSCLAYADDVVLMADSITKLSQMVADLRGALATAGLEISTESNKNLVMRIKKSTDKAETDTTDASDGCNDDDHYEEITMVTLGGVPFKLVSEMTVLGCKVTADDSPAAEVENR